MKTSEITDVECTMEQFSELLKVQRFQAALEVQKICLILLAKVQAGPK